MTVVCCLFGDVYDGSYPEVMDGCKQNCVRKRTDGHTVYSWRPNMAHNLHCLNLNYTGFIKTGNFFSKYDSGLQN